LKYWNKNFTAYFVGGFLISKKNPQKETMTIFITVYYKKAESPDIGMQQKLINFAGRGML